MCKLLPSFVCWQHNNTQTQFEVDVYRSSKMFKNANFLFFRMALSVCVCVWRKKERRENDNSELLLKWLLWGMIRFSSAETSTHPFAMLYYWRHCWLSAIFVLTVQRIYVPSSHLWRIKSTTNMSNINTFNPKIQSQINYK